MSATCPTCSGAKVLRGIACRGKSAGPFELPCFDCQGTGQVDDVRAIWTEHAKTLRAFRERRDFSLHEAARWLGIPPSEWSDAEHGRVDPTGILGRVQRKAVEDIRRKAGVPPLQREPGQ